ncbi:VOC family protein [Paracoccus sp. Z330]|uniref:VOC family protein n=1 Tax=Paracoccus onchidii TaxID=3017813 RepID=A0ABT4ZJQ8_9RHOB|nr:VOC family protein [Paracoccus onchidii]MDB6179517.1 VOC family protein [Paracoccus onchidii]
MSCPIALNHVGIVVPELETAIAWYSNVMGFTLVAGPFDLRDDGPNGAQVLNVLGKNLRHLRQAHMSTANSVGLELFQPVDPAYQKPDHKVEFWRGGFFHICVTDPDVGGLVDRIVATGGKQISDIWPERGADQPYLMCYCTDPFGNVIEIYSHQYEYMQGHRTAI